MNGFKLEDLRLFFTVEALNGSVYHAVQSRNLAIFPKQWITADAIDYQQLYSISSVNLTNQLQYSPFNNGGIYSAEYILWNSLPSMDISDQRTDIATWRVFSIEKLPVEMETKYIFIYDMRIYSYIHIYTIRL